MAKKRESRAKIDKEDHDLLKPIDIFKLGSEEDVCFGTQHDLLAKECRTCGDSEFCAIATAQSLKQRNLSMEQEKRFKDIEEADLELKNKKDKALKLINELREKGLGNTKILLKVWEKTKLTKDEVKQLINK